MCQPERFQIDITEPISSYRYVGPYESTVCCHYPREYVVHRYHPDDCLLSDTAAIRRELTEIRSDINEIKRRNVYPTHYVAQQDYPNSSCSLCPSYSFADNQPNQYNVQDPASYCEEYPTYVEQRPSTARGRYGSSTGVTTYQDHYREPSQHRSYSGRTKRQTTMNEHQTESPRSSTVQHPRHWVPAASKNSYPNRRYNLSVPHSEP